MWRISTAPPRPAETEIFLLLFLPQIQFRPMRKQTSARHVQMVRIPLAGKKNVKCSPESERHTASCVPARKKGVQPHYHWSTQKMPSGKNLKLVKGQQHRRRAKCQAVGGGSSSSQPKLQPRRVLLPSFQTRQYPITASHSHTDCTGIFYPKQLSLSLSLKPTRESRSSH